MKGFPMGKKPIRASCRVIGTILVNISISLLPTPSRVFPIRWAHSGALRQSLIYNAKYESTVKICNKRSINWSTKLISKRPNCWADYQIRRFSSNCKNKSLNSHENLQIELKQLINNRHDSLILGKSRATQCFIRVSE